MFGKPIRITEGVYQIRAIGARVTVLSEGRDLMLVDAGLWGSSRAIADGLRDLGRTPHEIQGIAITHAHPDHSGGLAELAMGTDISVAAHALEADIIEGTTAAPNPLRWKLVGPMSWSVLNRLMGSPVPVHHRVEDGDRLPFQAEVQVVHLPGHTPGSIGLYLPRKRVVIVGDACSTSWAGNYIRQPRVSPKAPTRRFVHLRNSSIWTSIPSASATSPLCAISLGRPLRNF